VTQADVNSEKLIKKILQKAYPDFVFLGEESGRSSAAENVPMWHVDPLDGTTNFVHGFPMFCVSIGLAIGDTPLLGVIHIPTLRETIHGHIGGGVYLNKKKVRTSSRKDISEALLTTGFSYLHEEQKLAAEVARFQKVSLAARAVRRPGAAAIDLAYVAAGIFDGFWEKNLSSWDVCAGAALVKEAGGMVSNYQGQEMVFGRKEILATNGHIHQPMMDILK
jgi:myo-inositol-1(or 4)-monophosphatase